MASVRGLDSHTQPATPVSRRNHMIRRFNRMLLNPIMLGLAARFRGTYPAVVHHSGRHSKRSYRTPVVAQPVDDGFIIPLPYGTETDWCRNVRAAGYFRIERAGQTFEVSNPEVVAPAEALPLVRDQARRAWQRFRIKNFLRVRTRNQDGARTASTRSQWEQPSRGLAEAIRYVEMNEHRKESPVNQEEAKRRSERVTGVSNVAYDLMVVLTNTLEGVAAIEEYKLDAVNDPEVRAVFERIEQRDRQSIEELRGLLIDHLQRIQVS